MQTVRTSERRDPLALPTRIRSRLLLAGLVSLAALVASPAFATPALLWNFDDFPTAQQGNAVGDAVYPIDYGCGSSGVCTGTEIAFFAAGNGVNGTISKSIDGVTGTFSRPNWQAPGTYAEYDLLAVGSVLSWGNTVPGSVHPYLADFSVGFTSAAVDLEGPYDLGAPFGAYGAFLDMWSGPGGTGTLLARAEVLPGESYAGTLALDAPAGTTAHSLTFGRFRVGSPSCVYEPYGSGLSFPCLYAVQANADDIRIAPVPEPGPAVAIAAGLLAIGAARRSSRSGSAIA